MDLEIYLTTVPDEYAAYAGVTHIKIVRIPPGSTGRDILESNSLAGHEFARFLWAQATCPFTDSLRNELNRLYGDRS